MHSVITSTLALPLKNNTKTYTKRANRKLKWNAKKYPNTLNVKSLNKPI